MAVNTSNRIEAEQQIRAIMEKLAVPTNTESVLAELRSSVNGFETRYGMPSERIHDAIEAGELIEDLDVCNWIFDFELLREIEAECAT